MTGRPVADVPATGARAESGIRPVGAADAALLAALQPACFDQPWVEHQWDEAAFRSALSMPGAFGLTIDGPAALAGSAPSASAAAVAPVGFAIGRVAADEAELLSIGLVPAARRAGRGRRLLDAALVAAAARGAGRMFLEVAETNEAGRRLYGGAGFTEVGRRRGYYPGGGGRVDALVLRLDLPPQPPQPSGPPQPF